ncbi:hypothetical protein [Kushneria konosiri]|uniref:Uncharacterized protein n=1 Tax=Kushneria konosiri TaxID=698828 RepID=A0A2Z2H9Q8_9GAMM|nr:hypothetical protein [Kushneria konosiri]ARS53696.1 hypothetical protein B9G99_13210 [Kushneria konosiri]
MKGKAIAATGLAFAMMFGLSACGQDEPSEEAAQQAKEASQNSHSMEGEDLNTGADGQVGDESSMQGMNEASDGTEKGSDESISTREGGTAHTATNVDSSGAMTQAEESRNLDN